MMMGMKKEEVGLSMRIGDSRYASRAGEVEGGCSSPGDFA